MIKRLSLKLLDLSTPIWGGFINHILIPFIRKMQEKEKLKKIEQIKRQDEYHAKKIENVISDTKMSKVEKDRELKSNFDSIMKS